jgi:hypothetical protein
MKEEDETADMLLLDLRHLVEEGRSRQASRLAIERLDDWLLTSDFKHIDNVLSRADVSQLPPIVLLAIESTSGPGREHLPSFKSFRARVRTKMYR